LRKNLTKNLLKTPERIVTEPFPGVLAVAGTSVLAFRNLMSIGDHSFWDVHVGLLEGREPDAVVDEYEQGFSGCLNDDGVPDDSESCPRLQAPAAKF
jgi:hypothetical protein